MNDESHNELRQIKWILAGMLACLVLIVLVMAPELRPVARFVAMIGALSVIMLVGGRFIHRHLTDLGITFIRPRQD